MTTDGMAAIAERIAWAVDGLELEIPSWGFANTGTRFRVFPQAGTPRDTWEKIDDVATVAISVGERETVAAAAVNGAHLGQREDSLHESRTVDRERE